MAVIDFLRHGATEAPGHLAGRTDVALSEEGWRQFERQTAALSWQTIGRALSTGGVAWRERIG